MITLALLLSAASREAPVPPASPAVLGPGTVSQDGRYEFCSTLSRDRRILYVGIEHGDWQSTLEYRWSGEAWAGPVQRFGTPDYTVQDPYLSHDEQRLYFITRAEGSADIGYYPADGDGGWGEPVLLGEPINSEAQDYFVSKTRGGDYYFSSDREPDGYYDLYVGREGGEAKRLETVNSDAYEGDPFVDPDGRYLIFASDREGGKGRGDLYFSLSDGAGGWQAPIAFDERVNTAGHELCPMVSLDGSAFMFTSNKDIHWVSTSIIEEMVERAGQEPR
ncbi:TolB family protein [Sphingomicrobium aestuariivivum]|uniref:TolB family protein n=1 Tax=Sphingomicrobium aestuariivivum TaxID=1582356 RepID=UPI001FD6884C|nr:hypothetical protein [Sphingomicrobium aestuariivivum]MCJ8190761.1 hypothetical protein [Sphingomicrobium aestuariivivum]